VGLERGRAQEEEGRERRARARGVKNT
jgi:hypothetical protein